MERGDPLAQRTRYKHLKDEAKETVNTMKFGRGQGGADDHGLGWSGGF